MTLFDQRHLSQLILKLDTDGLRRGYYSDQYFENIVHVLEGARAAGYRFAGQSPRSVPPEVAEVQTGDVVVEAQVFTRRDPVALVAGVDVALTMLRHATGYFEGGHFVETWNELDVEAVQDGVFVRYEGDSRDVEPVIKVRGRYRDFALLETAILGVLARASRLATNVYHVLTAANGKPILFFPARFDVPDVQSLDGYAYWLAVQRYNHDSGKQVNAVVSTDAQGAWWGGHGGGTIPHALIAAFLGDTAEAACAFAQYVSIDVPRVALVDFENDSVGTSVAVLNAFWPRYLAALQAGDTEGQKRWTLFGVRLDTSSNMRDVALEPDGPKGVNPPLVRAVRAGLDRAWESWKVAPEWAETARDYCRRVKIVATGGFNRARIEQFERDNVPVDIYGVGSAFLQNDSDTNTDFTMDVVRVKIGSQWVDMAKVGRQANDNPDLRPVDLSQF